jgi:biopolymer transport protein ExbD/biopolymer transport protein TolR
MGMQVGNDSGGLVADINVTPLVDVMLVLLIIFMVIAPLLQTGAPVTVPKTKNPELDNNIVKDTSAVIAVGDDGRIYFGRDVSSLAELPGKLKKTMEGKKEEDRIIYVKGGKSVKYGQVVEVIDKIRESGYDRIGLVSEKEREAAAAPAK